MAMATPASAAPTDALTEKSYPVTRVKDATDYDSRQNGGCQIRRHAPVVSVTCERGEYVTLEYDFTVPAKAINFRDRPLEYTSSGTTAKSYAVVEGYRAGARHYILQVGFGERGTYTFEETGVRYGIPTAYDRRPCVTKGEWARINPAFGGLGGKLAKVAAVFDSYGKRTYLSPDYDGFRYQIRAYKRCGSEKVRKVTFHHYPNDPGWWSYWG